MALPGPFALRQTRHHSIDCAIIPESGPSDGVYLIIKLHLISIIPFDEKQLFDLDITFVRQYLQQFV